MQNFGTQACQLQHFFKGDGVHTARFGYHARVGGVNAVHIGINLAFVCLEGSSQRHGRSIRTAAAEGGNVAFGIYALETGDNHYATFLQIGAHGGVVDVFDARFGVRAVGFYGNLPAGITLGIDADVFQRHGQQADGDLFAGGQYHIQFARIGEFLHFMRQRHQSVGFAAHGGYDYHHVVTGFAGFRHALGHVFDAFGRADRGAAVFLYN